MRTHMPPAARCSHVDVTAQRSRMSVIAQRSRQPVASLRAATPARAPRARGTAHARARYSSRVASSPRRTSYAVAPQVRGAGAYSLRARSRSVCQREDAKVRARQQGSALEEAASVRPVLPSTLTPARYYARRYYAARCRAFARRSRARAYARKQAACARYARRRATAIAKEVLASIYQKYRDEIRAVRCRSWA